MTCLLFPGRHHLLTNFQLEQLTLATSGSPTELLDVNGRPLGLTAPIDTVIWPVTSANHANTRRNPLPAHRRETAIEDLAEQLDAESFVYLIDDVGASPEFAEYVLKKIEVDSHGRFTLTPANTVVGCSTPSVIEMYERLGFKILPFELADRATKKFRAETPWELLELLVAAGLAGRDWRTEEAFLTKVSRATRRLYLKYRYGDAIVDLHRRPLLTEDGDLTATRDYNTYVRSFDDGARRKYEKVRDFVQPGRIVDIGCCTGSLIRELTLDDRLRESDFYGIEVARPLYAECLHRKEQGVFANDNVFFYQRDFAAGPVFTANSVNTFLTCALTHEIESYGGRDSLRKFIELLFAQTAPRGRWVNVDVTGPEDPDRTVLMRLKSDDGQSDDFDREFTPDSRDELRTYLEKLSTLGRFLRFARDFRHDEGYRLPYERLVRGRASYVRLSLRDACEFLSKKDYLDNWQSEMHETFCFWNLADWRIALETAGFRVLPASQAYVNPWLVENRYRGNADLFEETPAGLLPLAYPVTNLTLVAEKA